MDGMAQHLNKFYELANQLLGLSEDGKGINNSELATILALSLPRSDTHIIIAP